MIGGENEYFCLNLLDGFYERQVLLFVRCLYVLVFFVCRKPACG